MQSLVLLPLPPTTCFNCTVSTATTIPPPLLASTVPRLRFHYGYGCCGGGWWIRGRGGIRLRTRLNTFLMEEYRIKLGRNCVICPIDNGIISKSSTLPFTSFNRAFSQPYERIYIYFHRYFFHLRIVAYLTCVVLRFV